MSYEIPPTPEHPPTTPTEASNNFLKSSKEKLVNKIRWLTLGLQEFTAVGFAFASIAQETQGDHHQALTFIGVALLNAGIGALNLYGLSQQNSPETTTPTHQDEAESSE